MGAVAEFRCLGRFRRQREHWSLALVEAVGSEGNTPVFLTGHQILFKKCIIMPGRYCFLWASGGKT